MIKVLRSQRFWIPFLITAVVCSLFFAWEAGYFVAFVSSPPRAQLTQNEMIFTIILIILLSLNAGLFAWQQKYGHCPVGTRGASSVAGMIGAITLLCPACLLIPISILGISISFTFLSPYLPLLRIIAMILLITSTVMLWPRKKKSGL